MRIIDIRGLNIELTDALHAFVHEKLRALEKLCESYSPCDVSVEIGKITPAQHKGNIWRAELRMTIPGNSFHIERVTDDLYAAIDLAKDALKQQIVDYKRK